MVLSRAPAVATCVESVLQDPAAAVEARTFRRRIVACEPGALRAPRSAHTFHSASACRPVFSHGVIRAHKRRAIRSQCMFTTATPRRALPFVDCVPSHQQISRPNVSAKMEVVMLRNTKLSMAFSLALGSLSLAAGAVHAAVPTITNSSSTSTSLTINGTNLSGGTATVTLGSSGPLPVTSQTATKLVVTFSRWSHRGRLHAQSADRHKNQHRSVGRDNWCDRPGGSRRFLRPTGCRRDDGSNRGNRRCRCSRSARTRRPGRSDGSARRQGRHRCARHAGTRRAHGRHGCARFERRQGRPGFARGDWRDGAARCSWPTGTDGPTRRSGVDVGRRKWSRRGLSLWPRQLWGRGLVHGPIRHRAHHPSVRLDG